MSSNAGRDARLLQPSLRTERLSLEALSLRHAPRLLAYYERNRAYLERWEPARSARFYSESYQHESISLSVAESEAGRCARFVAFEPGNDEIVANFNLWNIRRAVIWAAIVGYSVGEAYAGRGYASELLDALVRYGFDTLGLHRIETSYQPDNRASGRVLEKNGFRVEGYATDYLYLNGAWRDGVLVGRIDPGWRYPDDGGAA